MTKCHTVWWTTPMDSVIILVTCQIVVYLFNSRIQRVFSLPLSKFDCFPDTTYATEFIAGKIGFGPFLANILQVFNRTLKASKTYANVVKLYDFQNEVHRSGKFSVWGPRAYFKIQAKLVLSCLSDYWTITDLCWEITELKLRSCWAKTAQLLS